MATYYSDQYQDAYVDVPSNKIAPGDIAGSVEHAAFNVTLAGAVALNEKIKLAKIPKGAKVLFMRFVSSDLGTTGDLDIGWSASAALDSSGSPIVAASATGIAAAVDVNAAAVATQYYPNQHFAEEVDLQLNASEATTAAGTISGYIMYVRY